MLGDTLGVVVQYKIRNS